MAGTRQLLDAERKKALRRLATLRVHFDDVVEAAVDSNVDDEHDPEGATIAYERSQLEALVAQAAATVAETDAAIGRLDAATYGRCESCGGVIADARLAARPLARTCIDCADPRGATLRL